MVLAGGRAWMIDEYLIRFYPDRLPTVSLPLQKKKVYLHSHCYQKSRAPAADGLPTGTGATAALLRSAGYPGEVLDDGCCGMAGAFGYEAEHYEVSMNVGGLVLFPTLKAAQQADNDSLVVAAPGVSCRAQIEDGTGLVPCHPIQLISNLIK